VKLKQFFFEKPLNLLILAIPLAILAEVFHWGPLWVFLFSTIGIVPMAGLIGESTEVLASHTGPRLGGLLNATLGNAAELIITIVAIRGGLLELVKASITGSILGNILFVLGMAMLLGGIKNGIQTFDRRQATNNAILLILSVIALLIPSMLSSFIGPVSSIKVEALSLGVAAIMIVLYGLGVFYSFREQRGPLPAPAMLELETTASNAGNRHAQVIIPKEHHMPLRTALISLAISTIAVAYLSELFVSTVEPVVIKLGVSEFFLGIILIPIIGNVAEHLVAVKVAIQNHMDLSVEVAIASSLQIALFVAPFLVFISLIMGNPLQLIFNEFELLALITGGIIAALVSLDGESNWLEGAVLLAVYFILGLAFFLLPV